MPQMQAGKKTEKYKTKVRRRGDDKLERLVKPEQKERTPPELHPPVAQGEPLWSGSIEFSRESGNVYFYVKPSNFSVQTSYSKKCFGQKRKR